jgi:hypothetical protein
VDGVDVDARDVVVELDPVGELAPRHATPSATR